MINEPFCTNGMIVVRTYNTNEVTRDFMNTCVFQVNLSSDALCGQCV
jgi:hypothetical protein